MHNDIPSSNKSISVFCVSCLAGGCWGSVSLLVSLRLCPCVGLGALCEFAELMGRMVCPSFEFLLAGDAKLNFPDLTACWVLDLAVVLICWSLSGICCCGTFLWFCREFIWLFLSTRSFSPTAGVFTDWLLLLTGSLCGVVVVWDIILWFVGLVKRPAELIFGVGALQLGGLSHFLAGQAIGWVSSVSSGIEDFATLVALTSEVLSFSEKTWSRLFGVMLRYCRLEPLGLNTAHWNNVQYMHKTPVNTHTHWAPAPYTSSFKTCHQLNPKNYLKKKQMTS